MKTRTLLGTGLAAIAGVVAVALVVLDQAPQPSPLAPAAALPAEEPGAAAPASDAAAAPAALEAAPASLESKPLPEITPPVPGGRRSAASTIPWERVPVAARVGQLGPEVSGAVLVGLQNARAQMDSCFQDEARLLASGGGPRFDPNDPPAGPGALTLLLQSRPGGVDVVATEVVSHGTSSPQLVGCVRHVLEGWPMTAPKASAGRRYKLRYAIQ